jgi:Domain of unknown function (DUF4160)
MSPACSSSDRSAGSSRRNSLRCTHGERRVERHGGVFGASDGAQIVLGPTLGRTRLEITQGVRYHANGHPRGRIRGEDLHLRPSPPYVHVAKAGAIVRIDLATRTVTEIVGAISNKDVKRVERLVAKHANRLKEEWTRIHGND